MIVTAVGGVAGVVAAPWILGAAGFTSAGKSTFFPVISFFFTILKNRLSIL